VVSPSTLFLLKLFPPFAGRVKSAVERDSFPFLNPPPWLQPLFVLLVIFFEIFPTQIGFPFLPSPSYHPFSFRHRKGLRSPSRSLCCYFLKSRQYLFVGSRRRLELIDQWSSSRRQQESTIPIHPFDMKLYDQRLSLPPLGRDTLHSLPQADSFFCDNEELLPPLIFVLFLFLDPS